MKKLFAVALATLVIAGLAFGQGMPAKGKMTLGVGGEFGLPMGDFGDGFTMGFGGSGRFQYGLQDNITLYGQAAYLSWSEDEDVLPSDANSYSLEFVAGGKYGFGSGFYGLAELGINSFGFSYDYTDPVSGQTSEFDDSESKFVLAPGLGYMYQGFTVEVKYFLIDSDLSHLRFRVGYDFAL